MHSYLSVLYAQVLYPLAVADGKNGNVDEAQVERVLASLSAVAMDEVSD